MRSAMDLFVFEKVQIWNTLIYIYVQCTLCNVHAIACECVWSQVYCGTIQLQMHMHNLHVCRTNIVFILIIVIHDHRSSFGHLHFCLSTSISKSDKHVVTELAAPLPRAVMKYFAKIRPHSQLWLKMLRNVAENGWVHHRSFPPTLQDHIELNRFMKWLQAPGMPACVQC